ncbi:MAG: hypothetical protein IJ203_08695 [Atopobiaceae bacterium]|jgi:hypothetical protein|nr:hypothetical protein [Atopobiaceae bacterium]
MNLDNLNNDQLTRLQQCETPEQLMSLIETEGIELPDEALDDVAGGINPTAAIYQFVKRYLTKHFGN